MLVVDETAAMGILHVDMDAFYVAVEVQADPSLRGRPVVVGGLGSRGVVASCSYEARRYGVHSAMPIMRARRLCPDAVFLPGRHQVYGEVSRRLHEVFHQFTPLVEGIALDEAFLDVRGAQRLFGPPDRIAWAVRRAVDERLGLSCSVGVARSKLLAKLASKRAKPLLAPEGVRPGPGVVVVAPGQELAFLHPLPVAELWGVGPKTEARLGSLGVATVGDLARLPEETLVAAVGRAVGRQLHQLAWASDPRPVEPDRAPKSISHEETYSTDHRDREHLGRQVVRLADAACSRLRAEGHAARTVTLKVRFADFSTITRSRTLAEPTGNGPLVAQTARSLLGGVDVSAGVRLLGVALSGLVCPEPPAGESRQLSLEDLARTDDAREAKAAVDARDQAQAAVDARDQAQAAVDAVRARFGTDALGPAVLLGPGGIEVKRPGDSQWGPRPGSRSRCSGTGPARR
jgi:DNA polymerase-4